MKKTECKQSVRKFNRVWRFFKNPCPVLWILTILFFTNIASLHAQNEKRLALVIGNADYKVGQLKNPVKDAILMATAFDSLGFDVILDTNIQTKSEFEKVIREFDVRRENYDVGFVYYAGHGIQVGSENFMIPTNESLEKEEDVYYAGINVQMIIRILTRTSNEVNVLILDACRNNPFEQKWNRNRSFTTGNGLAKMQAPMGSLIAFATTAGNVAPDGDGENSIYCTALWNNMFKERVSLDQFFRDVRSEVLKKTNGQQQTEESTQLTGETFYLVQSNYSQLYKIIDSLITEKNYFEALDLTQKILYESFEKEAIIIKGKIYHLLGEYSKEIEHLDKFQLLYPDWIELLELRGATYWELEDYGKAKQVYKSIVRFNPENFNSHIDLAISYEYLNEFDSAISSYTRAIELAPLKTEFLSFRSDSYLLKGDTLKALEDLNKALQINDSTWTAYSRIAEIYEQIDELDKAYEIYQEVIKRKHTPIYELSHALNNQALILESMGKPEDAALNLMQIIDNFKDTLSKEAISITYRNLGDLYFNKLNEPEKSISAYRESIKLDSWQGTYRSLVNALLSIGDTLEALSVSDELLEIDRNPYDISDKADILFHFGAYAKSIDLYEESNSKIVNTIDDERLINWNINKIAQCYWMLAKPKKAIHTIEKAINNSNALVDSLGISELYRTSSSILAEEGEVNEAIQSIKLALGYNPSVENYEYLEYYHVLNNDHEGLRVAMEDGLRVAKNKSDSILLIEQVLVSEIDWHEWDKAEQLSNLLILLSDKPDFHIYAGKIALYNSKLNEALEHFNAAIEVDSSYIDAYFLRSKVWKAIGNEKLLLFDLNKTISIDNNDPEGYYYVALFYHEKGQFLKALKYLDLTITKYKDDYYISTEDGNGTIELGNVYIQRAEVYRILGDTELMCEDLKTADALGTKVNLGVCGNQD